MKNKARLQQKYEKEVAPKLESELGIKNKMAIPRIEKVTINMGVGNVIKSKEALESLKKDFALITGQLPSIRTAKISIASFGVRQGMPVGLAVTLRGERMYSFLDRLFSIVLPRLRDFRGLSLKSFDKFGNYTLGIWEHTVFPEIGVGKSAPHGMEITITTNAKDKEKAKKLLELLGMPFEKGVDTKEQKN
jgi:large subunit ribosomal protein L5